MLPKEFQHFRAISARTLLLNPDKAPNLPGAYAFFFAGGKRLLEECTYFDLGGSPPLSLRRTVHLYTGAAMGLKDRLQQHLRSDITSSSLRRSLLAVEQRRQAISLSGTAVCQVKGERSLTVWLSENAWILIGLTDDPFGLERQILSNHASPFNIAYRRQTPFARVLSEWRQAAFPASRPEKARRVRYR